MEAGNMNSASYKSLDISYTGFLMPPKQHITTKFTATEVAARKMLPSASFLLPAITTKSRGQTVKLDFVEK